MENEQKK